MKNFALLTIAATLATTACAKEPIFAAASQTRSELILQTPPAAGSDTTKAELAELHRLEAARTPAQIARAKADEALETMFLYKDVMGEKFTAENLPHTALFAAHIKNDEGVNANPAKLAFQRVRPYNLDKSLHPICATKTMNDSYPSSHATAGYLAALALIDMVPEKREAILARADEYAHNRLICGVHYSSDVQASKLVAYATHTAMYANPQYQQELATAKAELRAAMGLTN